MKFIRFIYKNDVKSGIIKDSQIYEIDHGDNKELLDIDFNRDIISGKSYNYNEIKIIEPTKPSKLVCIGLNYKEHGEELEMELPEESKIFLKPETSVIAHEDPIIYPQMSNQVDYEGELAVVIGRKCKDVDIEEAKNYIFGYTIVNDVTARDLQAKDGQWTRAKSFDTFAPIGPCIETDLNPLDQKIETKVNGKIKQYSNTKNMIFNVYQLLSFISNIMTLNSGDVISTGTPKGVGEIKPNDTVEITIENIGTLKNTLIKN
jgi:2-keto-4-pentenoate hydratase/2-oxohepta-3-ene-1,7-dioic acid hydratase in catechol pathway